MDKEKTRKGEKMSLRKGLTLLLLAAFTLNIVPVSATNIPAVLQFTVLRTIHTPPVTTGQNDVRMPIEIELEFALNTLGFDSMVDAPGTDEDAFGIDTDGDIIAAAAGNGGDNNAGNDEFVDPAVLVLRAPTGYRFGENRLTDAVDDLIFRAANGGVANADIRANVDVVVGEGTAFVPNSSAIVARVITAAAGDAGLFGNLVQQGDLVVYFLTPLAGDPLNGGTIRLRIRDFDLICKPSATPLAAGTNVEADIISVNSQGAARDAFQDAVAGILKVPLAISAGGDADANEVVTIGNADRLNQVDSGDTSIVVQNAASNENTVYLFGTDLSTAFIAGINTHDIHIDPLVLQGAEDPATTAAANDAALGRTRPGVYSTTNSIRTTSFVTNDPQNRFTDNAEADDIAAIDISSATNFPGTANTLITGQVLAVDPTSGTPISGANVIFLQSLIGAPSNDSAPGYGSVNFVDGGNTNDVINSSADADLLLPFESAILRGWGGSPFGLGTNQSAAGDAGLVGLVPDQDVIANVADYVSRDALDDLGVPTTTVGDNDAAADSPTQNAAINANVGTFVNATDPIQMILAAATNAFDGFHSTQLVRIEDGTNAGVIGRTAADANNASNAVNATVTYSGAFAGNGDATSVFDGVQIQARVAGGELLAPPSFLVRCGADDAGALQADDCGVADTNAAIVGNAPFAPIATVNATAGTPVFANNVIAAAQIDGTTDTLRIQPVNVVGLTNSGFPGANNLVGGKTALSIMNRVQVTGIPNGTSFNLIFRVSGNNVKSEDILLAQVLQAGGGNTNINARISRGEDNANEIFVRAAGTTADTATVAEQALANVDLTTLGNTVGTDINNLLAANQEFDTELAPLYPGSHQTTNINVTVCETEATAFDTFKAEFGDNARVRIDLPDTVRFNRINSNGTNNLGNIATVANSNGGAAAVESVTVGNASGTIPASIVIDVDPAGAHAAPAIDGTLQCFNVNIKGEAIVGPTTPTAVASLAAIADADANFSINVTDETAAPGTIIANIADAVSAAAEIPGFSDFLTRSATVRLATGSDGVTNNFVRTGHVFPNNVQSPNNNDRKLAGALAQNNANAPASGIRFADVTAQNNIVPIVVEEGEGAASGKANGFAWNRVLAPEVQRPNNILGTAIARSANGAATAEVVVGCTLDNGAAAQLTAANNVFPITDDLDIIAVQCNGAGNSNAGECVFQVADDPRFLGNTNRDIAQAFAAQLTINGIVGEQPNVQCHARMRQFDAGAQIIAALAGGEADDGNVAGLLFTPIRGANALVVNHVDEATDLDGTVTAAVVNAFDNGVQAQNDAYIVQFASQVVTLLRTAIDTVISVVSDALLNNLTVVVNDLPAESTADGDTDKEVQLTIPAGNLTPGLLVNFSNNTPSNDGGANNTRGVVDANGGVILTVRAADGQSLFLSSNNITNQGVAAIEITAEDQQANNAFVDAIVPQLQNVFSNSGDVPVKFTVGTTSGFNIEDVKDTLTVNGVAATELADGSFIAIVPAAAAYEIAVEVDGVEVTTVAQFETNAPVKANRGFGNRVKINKNDLAVFKGRGGAKIPRDSRGFAINLDGTVDIDEAPDFNRNRTRLRTNQGTFATCASSNRNNQCLLAI